MCYIRLSCSSIFIHLISRSYNECIQTPQLVQLINNVSNFIFHCNNCDANRVFVKFRESANQHGCRAKQWFIINAKFTFGRLLSSPHDMTDAGTLKRHLKTFLFHQVYTSSMPTLCISVLVFFRFLTYF